MAIAFVSAAADSGSPPPTTMVLAVPSHSTDDLIIAFCSEESTTATPSLPSGYTNIVNGFDANSVGYRVCYKIATSGSEPNVSFTVDAASNSKAGIVVYSGCDTTSPIGSDTSGVTDAQGGSTVTFPSGTLDKTDSTSWLIRVCHHSFGGTAMGALDDGSVDRVDNIAGIANTYIGDSDGGVSSWPTADSTAPNYDDWVAISFEILAAGGAPAAKPSSLPLLGVG